MTDYIEREAALRACGDEPLNWNDTDAELQEVADWKSYQNAIIAIPTADVQPVVHGEWIKVGSIENTWLVSRCSACGAQTIDAGCYCPNCGARMVHGG